MKQEKEGTKAEAAVQLCWEQSGCFREQMDQMEESTSMWLPWSNTFTGGRLCGFVNSPRALMQRLSTVNWAQHVGSWVGSVFLSPALFPALVDWGMWEALKQFPVLLPVAALVSLGVLAVADN